MYLYSSTTRAKTNSEKPASKARTKMLSKWQNDTRDRTHKKLANDVQWRSMRDGYFGPGNYDTRRIFSDIILTGKTTVMVQSLFSKSLHTHA